MGVSRGYACFETINDLADIVQTNILVDHFRRARIAEFAFAIVDRNQGPASDTTECVTTPHAVDSTRDRKAAGHQEVGCLLLRNGHG
jgi:hypothetical protein